MNLLEKMKFSIDTMTMGEKLLAGIQVTVLGLIIVFAALAILYFAIVVMEGLMNKSQKVAETVEPGLCIDETANPGNKESMQTGGGNTNPNMELIAVITAAVAASLNVSAQDVVVKNIRRVQDSTPIWAKMGRIEQINSML
ncbi:MAG: OadG family protein [Natronincolaceae bacterium]|jgi:sodium pump decarboxylase gamma subunit|nr:OadG family protein [Bacillota bacterium]NLK90063.1 OadG family protein [Clostridiales bacterium]